MSTETPFLLSTDGPIAHLRLNRPKVSNALNLAFWRELGPAVDALSAAGSVRALVLSGEGKHFCSGMDVSVFTGGAMSPPDGPAGRQAFVDTVCALQDTISCLERARFPVIAAIQGACLGAGLELASACDLRFASEDAYFRIEEINIGMMADVGSLQRLPSLLPLGVVKELALLGSALSAARAETLGFINSLTRDAAQALEAAMAAAHTVASKAPLAISGSKASIHHARDHSVAESLQWAALYQAAIWHTPDIIGAIMARQAKQPGSYAALAPITPLSG